MFIPLFNLPSRRGHASTTRKSARAAVSCMVLVGVSAFASAPAHAVFGLGDSSGLKACSKVIDYRNSRSAGFGENSYLKAWIGGPSLGAEGAAAFASLRARRPDLEGWSVKFEIVGAPSALAGFDKDFAAAAPAGISQTGFAGKWTATMGGKVVSSGAIFCAPIGEGPGVEVFEAHPTARDQVLSILRAQKAAPPGDKSVARSLAAKRRAIEVEATAPPPR